MTNDLAALSEAYTKSPNALSLTLLGHALVDEYRAGRLKPVNPEGMRGKSHEAWQKWDRENDASDWSEQANFDAGWNAAIAAILGDAA